ncbi:MAG: tRNA adenosine(34) deaminase TadA [Clostridia bacterium]|nr:tRNA adenosine(34) deaminase TadA [Clostridia bacterium]
MTEQDKLYMNTCIALASEAAARDEVPVGALIVQGDRVIASASNTREESKCATHHAEILAIEEACRTLGGWRLPNCTLYVTLEPCPMCAGAAINARIDRVVYGAPDPKGGALGSLVNLAEVPFNHKPEVEGGVLEAECAEVLTSYFRRKRKPKEVTP